MDPEPKLRYLFLCEDWLITLVNNKDRNEKHAKALWP